MLFDKFTARSLHLANRMGMAPMTRSRATSEHTPEALMATAPGMQSTDKIMTTLTHTARITGPVTYVSGNGRKVNIPLGPCMVEQTEGAFIDIVWGTRGQSSAALPSAVVQAAQDQGHLVLLDSNGARLT